MADDREKEFLLADLASLRLDGPCVLFLRPKRELTQDELMSVARIGDHLGVPGLRVVVVGADFEIMAAGEAELQALGWTKIPAPSPDLTVQ
jgi:hypothetical protein